MKQWDEERPGDLRPSGSGPHVPVAADLPARGVQA